MSESEIHLETQARFEGRSEPPLPESQYVELPIARDDEPKKKTYSAELDGIREAAKDLTEAREARESRTVPQADAEPTDRGYRWNAGQGDPVEGKYTVDAKRAAQDLSRARQADAANPIDTDGLAAAVDTLRATFPNRELPADFLQQLQQQSEAVRAQQQQQPQEQPAPVEQPQPDPVQDERQRLAQAWQNTPPEVQAALQQEVAATEQARQAYQQATWQAAQVSAAALFSNFPELSGLAGDQLAGAVAAIAKAQAITASIQRTKALYDASIQAQQQQQAIQAQQMQQWVAAQDAEFDRHVTAKESPESMRKLTQDVVALAEEYGVSRQELAALWQSQPIMRSAPFQRMMCDAARFRAAQKEVVNKLDRSTPPVQRPGVSQPRGDDNVAAAMKAFRSDPSPRSAAALLMARRAANRR
jgi:hypothetical protein